MRSPLYFLKNSVMLAIVKFVSSNTLNEIFPAYTARMMMLCMISWLIAVSSVVLLLASHGVLFAASFLRLSSPRNFWRPRASSSLVEWSSDIRVGGALKQQSLTGSSEDVGISYRADFGCWTSFLSRPCFPRLEIELKGCESKPLRLFIRIRNVFLGAWGMMTSATGLVVAS